MIAMAILTTRVEGEVYTATTWSAIEDGVVAIVEIEAVVTDDTFSGGSLLYFTIHLGEQ